MTGVPPKKSRLILTIAAFFLSCFAYAQIGTNGTLTNNNDTVPSATQPSFQSQGVVGLSITGSFTMTINFQASVDNTNWFAIQGTNTSTGVAGTSTATTGFYQLAASGARNVRVLASGASGGTATIVMYSWYNASGRGGGGGGGGGLSNPVTTAQGGFGINAAASTGIVTLAAGVTSIATLPFTSSNLTGFVPVNKGGCGADLSITGSATIPMFLRQASAGSNCTVTALTGLDIINGPTPDHSAISIVEEFFQIPGSSGQQYGTLFTQTFANGGSLNSSGSNFAGHPGVKRLSTGATNAAGSAALIGNNDWYIGDGTFFIEWLVNIEALSDGVNTYHFQAGYTSGVIGEVGTSALVVAMIRYNQPSSTAWIVATAKNAVPTECISTTTVTTGWHYLRETLNTNGSASFFVDGSELTGNSCSPVAAGTLGTGLSGTGGPTASIISTLSTAAKIVDVDRLSISQTPLAR